MTGTNSFGDPKAQPPTPKQTPTSIALASPVFQTPKNNQGSFEETSGWTPRFAEEYSVFNATPGNLRGSQGAFVDFSVSTPYQPSAGHKRFLSTESLASEIATHVNHFSPNPNLPLPPVDPARTLHSSSSSSGPPVAGPTQKDTNLSYDSPEHPVKRARCESVQEVQTQTVTPPPSARKGGRKLAPKLQTNTMQNDQIYGQEFVIGTPQQNNMPNFVTTPTDMFNYPMSAPATAPAFSDARSFWDDPGMNGMDIDFTAAGSNVFQTPNHRPMNSFDWGRTNEMFHETGVVPSQQNQENNPPAKRERPLAPKPTTSSQEQNGQDTSMFGGSFVTSIDDPFGMLNNAGGVDPGLLFSRPPSSSMEAATFDPMAQIPLMQSMSQPELIQLPAKQAVRGQLRRAASTREISTAKKADRVSASSPIKPSGRPGLARSFSESRGRKPAQRNSTLPTLAPAIRPTAQQPSGNRAASQGSRPNGKTSPLKHHHRLSSLSSIPESPTPRARTSVKFTIDSRGRARAETTMVAADREEPTPTSVRSRKESTNRNRNWGSSDEDDSSTDDEPIVIPSRNTSFALPDPRKATLLRPFHSAQTSISEQSTSSLGIYYGEPGSNINDVESEAETIMNEPDSNGGDAASELRKVVEDRQKRISLNTGQRFVSGPAHSTSSTISPTTMTDGSLPTPSSSRGNAVRCVCKRAESPHSSDGFMVQW